MLISEKESLGSPFSDAFGLEGVGDSLGGFKKIAKNQFMSMSQFQFQQLLTFRSWTRNACYTISTFVSFHATMHFFR